MVYSPCFTAKLLTVTLLHHNLKNIFCGIYQNVRLSSSNRDIETYRCARDLIYATQAVLESSSCSSEQIAQGSLAGPLQESTRLEGVLSMLFPGV
jgi:hypothetical protein